MALNAPNRLTLLRLVLIAPFLGFLLHDHPVSRTVALCFFIAAGLTDLYDGRMARRRGLVTTLGTFLDPLADKLLISAAFIAFVQIPEFYVPAWMVVLIIGREFLITGLRSLAASAGRILPAQPAGKFKMTSQIVVITTIILIMITNSALVRFDALAEIVYGSGTGWRVLTYMLYWGPYWLTLAITALTVISGVVYIKQNSDLFHDRSPTG